MENELRLTEKELLDKCRLFENTNLTLNENFCWVNIPTWLAEKWSVTNYLEKEIEK